MAQGPPAGLSASASIELDICDSSLLAFKGLYRYWKYMCSRGLKQMEAGEDSLV